MVDESERGMSLTKQILAVDCPSCGVSAGSPCISGRAGRSTEERRYVHGDGKTPSYFHKARRETAETRIADEEDSDVSTKGILLECVYIGIKRIDPTIDAHVVQTKRGIEVEYKDRRFLIEAHDLN